ncbi:olfactory receptor 12D1-like [Pelobates fuscus]|uniref:olfactory receptor 12D1-like n=1 Tax=Pelobates fuscus TaxID=191477 RepID=UPI002FE470F9
MANNSGIFSYELLVFPGLPEKYEILVSVAMFLIYNMSLITNGIVILLVFSQRNLHHPMYKFIGNLALSDLLFDTITLPKIVAKYWNGDGSMSVPGCITQLFFVHFLGSLDSFLIMVMALDRYVAICKPLRYPSIVTNKFAAILCSLVWILAAIAPSHSTIRSAQINYCGKNKIKSCFCSTPSVFSLACTDYSTALQISSTIAVTVLLGPLSLIILSYIFIIKMIHSSSRSKSWQKVFHTCTTHFLVIGLYYIPRVTLYFTNLYRVVINADINVLLLCLYTYIPHLANPVIYCLRTEEIRNTLQFQYA